MTDPTEPMPRRPSEPGPREKTASYRALLARRLMQWAAGLAVVILLVISAYTAVAIRDSQRANTPTLKAAAAAAKAAKDSAARIADCTTPGRDCYQRGQRQTAGAVGNINQVVILAAACSSGLDSSLTVAQRQSLIQSCVIDRLAQRPAGP